MRKYFWVINLVAIALGSFFTGRAATNLIEARVFLSEDTDGARRPTSRRRRSPVASRRTKDANSVLRRNIFCSDCPPIIEVPAESDSDGELVRSTLNFDLVATLVSEDPEWSFASLREQAEDKTGLYRNGSQVMAGATITEIEERRVYVNNQGRIEYIDMAIDGTRATSAPTPTPETPRRRSGSIPPEMAAEIEAGVKKISDTEYEVGRSLIDKVLGDPSFLARSARIVPSVKDGKSNGFKIYAIRPNSVYAKIGLSNGDTIHAINGHEITSPDKALEVYTKVRTASHITVSLTRRGKAKTMDYGVR